MAANFAFQMQLISSKKGINMQSGFVIATLVNMGMNLLYTVLGLAIGLLALRFIDNKLLTNIKIEEELKNNNIAVAIFSSTVLLSVALIISFGLKM
jgi:uncharacterized membrane protein YjfL (UPF0719 family)